MDTLPPVNVDGLIELVDAPNADEGADPLMGNEVPSAGTAGGIVEMVL
jgi:hypothetical protein